MAEVYALIEGAMTELEVPSAAIPSWDDYLDDYRAGVPLLQCSSVEIDLDPAAGAIASLVEKTARLPLPDRLASESRALAAELGRDPDMPRRFLTWLRGGDLSRPGIQACFPIWPGQCWLVTSGRW